MMLPRSCAAIALVVLAHTASARADEHEAGAEAEGHEHHHHENHVAVFVGATTTLVDTDPTHATIGIDYERRLPFADRMIGVGALVDAQIVHEAETEVETIIAPFVAIHPMGGLMILGAAGVAVTGAGHNGHLALRGGAAYFFPVGGFSVGPEVNVDHVNGENAVVYGVSAGMGF